MQTGCQCCFIKRLEVELPLLPKYYQPIDSSVLGNKNDEEDKQKETLLKKHDGVSYSVAMGTGYTSFGSSASMMNSYIAPTVNYQVNSKLNFSVTGIIMQNNFNGLDGFYGNQTGYSYNSNPSNYGITGTAYYQLNDKWAVWGDGAYLENQSVFNDYRAQAYDNDFKTMSIGVGYKLNDNLRFNIQYRYSNGLNPAYQYNPVFNSRPYSPFNTGFGSWYY